MLKKHCNDYIKLVKNNIFAAKEIIRHKNISSFVFLSKKDNYNAKQNNIQHQCMGGSTCRLLQACL